jgi:hypothetical protein
MYNSITRVGHTCPVRSARLSTVKTLTKADHTGTQKTRGALYIHRSGLSKVTVTRESAAADRYAVEFFLTSGSSSSMVLRKA